uniref:AT5G10110-like protein n=1 Tax=Arabidopsis arenosa TaxID=38785 RepID=B7U9T1_ARAAE|nr:AT5G10110-like protein [Arabidopsis arenosa]
MTEDSSKSVSEQTRPVLGDLTNLPSKRGISSILGDLLDESGKTIAHEVSREKFSKRLCLVVDDLVKENARPLDTIERSSSFDKNASGDSVDKEESEEYHDAVMEFSSGDGKSLKESKSVQIYFEPGDRDGAREFNAAANANQTDVTGEGLALYLLPSNTESRNLLKTGKELSDCQNLRSFGMSRCSNVNSKEHLRICGQILITRIPKVDYPDLFFVSSEPAMKKSQKAASNLIQRNAKERPTDFHVTENSVSFAKQESKLMAQWRSLFLSMGDILAQENSHLQNSFVRMKKLREDCRMDIERAMKTPKHNTQIRPKYKYKFEEKTEKKEKTEDNGKKQFLTYVAS